MIKVYQWNESNAAYENKIEHKWSYGRKNWLGCDVDTASVEDSKYAEAQKLCEGKWPT